MAASLEGDEKTGANIILKALESPLMTIAYNAGLEGAVSEFPGQIPQSGHAVLYIIPIPGAPPAGIAGGGQSELCSLCKYCVCRNGGVLCRKFIQKLT